MSYQRNYWHDGDLISAEKMNHLEDGIVSAESGYDLIIDVGGATNTVLVGDILECEDKLDNNIPINAICIYHQDWSVIPSGSNSNKCAKFLPLVQFNAPYCVLRFCGVVYDSRMVATYVNVAYDPIDGSIENVYIGSVNV